MKSSKFVWLSTQYAVFYLIYAPLFYLIVIPPVMVFGVAVAIVRGVWDTLVGIYDDLKFDYRNGTLPTLPWDKEGIERRNKETRAGIVTKHRESPGPEA